jgi:hypothetical protein
VARAAAENLVELPRAGHEALRSSNSVADSARRDHASTNCGRHYGVMDLRNPPGRIALRRFTSILPEFLEPVKVSERPRPLHDLKH